MSNKPVAVIVKSPWNKETKKWAEEYGAVWEKVWPDGKTTFSVKFSKLPPTDSYVSLVFKSNQTFQDKPKQEQPIVDSNNFDDDIPF